MARHHLQGVSGYLLVIVPFVHDIIPNISSRSSPPSDSGKQGIWWHAHGHNGDRQRTLSEYSFEICQIFAISSPNCLERSFPDHAHPWKVGSGEPTLKVEMARRVSGKWVRRPLWNGFGATARPSWSPRTTTKVCGDVQKAPETEAGMDDLYVPFLRLSDGLL